VENDIDKSEKVTSVEANRTHKTYVRVGLSSTGPLLRGGVFIPSGESPSSKNGLLGESRIGHSFPALPLPFVFFEGAPFGVVGFFTFRAGWCLDGGGDTKPIFCVR
jgi:hypothetical protein